VDKAYGHAKSLFNVIEARATSGPKRTLREWGLWFFLNYILSKGWRDAEFDYDGIKTPLRLVISLFLVASLQL